MIKVGDKLKTATSNTIYTVKRVNKNGTLRVTFWNRNEVEVECTCQPSEFVL